MLYGRVSTVAVTPKRRSNLQNSLPFKAGRSPTNKNKGKGQLENDNGMLSLIREHG